MQLSRNLLSQARNFQRLGVYTPLSYAISDLAMLVLAAWLGGQLWSLVNSQVDPRVLYQLWPLLFIFPFAFARADLYSGGVSPVVEFARLGNLTTIVYLTALLVSFLIENISLDSRGVFLTSWGLTLLLLPTGRSVLRDLFADRAWWGTPTVILGSGSAAASVCEQLIGKPGSGFKPVACFGQGYDSATELYGVPVIGPITSATAWAKQRGVNHAIVAMPEVQSDELLDIIHRHTEAFPHLIFVSQLFGQVGLSVSRQELGQTLGLQIQRNLLLPGNRLLKRAVDLLITVPLCVLALPIVALAALAIMWVSPGSPFYFQLREGYRGRKVRVWKLRTMYLDAETRLEETLAKDPALRAEWERFYKIKDDPRVLPVVGDVLRKLSLDELPQLYNVLIGEMSLVGPRPFPYYHLEQFGADFRSLRREALPGITGLWQVSERSDGDLAVQEKLDSYYIRDWSIWFDLYLLARTPIAVFFGKGAY